MKKGYTWKRLIDLGKYQYVEFRLGNDALRLIQWLLELEIENYEEKAAVACYNIMREAERYRNAINRNGHEVY